MAIRTKTVEYWFPIIPTIADITTTDADQITIHIPEASPTFRSAEIEMIIADVYTTATNVTQRNIEFRLGAAAYTARNNPQTLTQSSENFTFAYTADFLDHFIANWSGSSMTADARVTINTNALGCRNASLKLTITYEFDDTATTQVKTVWIPLDAPTSNLPTAKSTVYDTIPALDTYLPEASKTFHQIMVVVQGNTEDASTTDLSLSVGVGATDFTSQLYERGSNIDYWVRVNADYSAINTAITHSFYLWSNSTAFNHPQAWMVVTYSFNASTTTSIMNSLILPMEIDSPMGGPGAGDYQRADRDLWIQEPNPVGQRLAYYMMFDKNATISGLNARIGTGTFVTYTDVATTMAGNSGFMIRNDSAYTLDNGRNTISVDVYNTDTVDLGYGCSGFWLVNYTSDVPTEGIWAANHTVKINYKIMGTTGAATQSITASKAFEIPTPSYFINSIGMNYIFSTSGTLANAGVHIGAERLVSEGGQKWELLYTDLGGTDAEVGIFQNWSTARSIFQRWKDGTVNNIMDADGSRLDLTVARRYRMATGNGQLSFDHLDLYLTYHAITYSIAGNITGVNTSGGDVTIKLHRSSTDDIVFEITIPPATSTLPYEFLWFDNTEPMYVTAFQDNSLVGRSASGLAS